MFHICRRTRFALPAIGLFAILVCKSAPVFSQPTAEQQPDQLLTYLDDQGLRRLAIRHLEQKLSVELHDNNAIKLRQNSENVINSFFILK